MFSLLWLLLLQILMLTLAIAKQLKCSISLACFSLPSSSAPYQYHSFTTGFKILLNIQQLGTAVCVAYHTYLFPRVQAKFSCS